jgi:nitrogen-specific signal transduction histidine kinase
MPNTTARSYRFRLMIALPVMVLCFTLAAGFLPLGILSSSVNDLSKTMGPEMTPVIQNLRVHIQNLRIAVLFITLAATSLAVAIASYIVRPIEQITQEIAELTHGISSGDNEIEALTRIYNQAVIPLRGMLSSSELLMQMSEGVIGLNRTGLIQVINNPVELLFGVDRLAYMGKSYTELFPNGTANFEIHELIREGLRAGVQHTRDVIVSTPSGRNVYIRVTVSPATGGRQESLGLILLFKSFDEFSRIRDDLRKLDVLASLGTSVAGMAHEIRTPLGYIRSLAELIAEDLPKDARERQYAATILDSIDRLNTMVANILSLSRPPTDMTSLQEAITLVREAVAYTRSALQPHQLLLVEDYADNVPAIRGDRERLLEAFINLFKNACEASPAGGVVTVRVRSVRVGGSTAPGGSAVMIEFHNTGPTIPPEQVDKLFLPFFTTKKEGTGLGLPITKQIIDSHDGAIRVESDPAAGTLFRVLLPTASETQVPATV